MSCVFGVLGTLLQTCSVGLILYAFADAGVIHALDGCVCHLNMLLARAAVNDTVYTAVTASKYSC